MDRWPNFRKALTGSKSAAAPAPGYCVSLDPEARQRLKEKLAETLPRRDDGAIPLMARAWAVRASLA